MAIDAVLTKLSTKRARPPLASLRGIVHRVPLIVSVGQHTRASLELRQIIELTFWIIFFSDHKVEWAEFEETWQSGPERDVGEPITFLAHRDCSFYAAYARQRFKSEPSGLALKAVNRLEQQRGTLHVGIHASRLARFPESRRPFDDPTDGSLSGFASSYKSISSSTCLALSAFFRARFDSLPPMHRAWFDWLVGKDTRLSIRAQEFGLG
jgi:hypothetical protein